MTIKKNSKLFFPLFTDFPSFSLSPFSLLCHSLGLSTIKCLQFTLVYRSFGNIFLTWVFRWIPPPHSRSPRSPKYFTLEMFDCRRCEASRCAFYCFSLHKLFVYHGALWINVNNSQMGRLWKRKKYRELFATWTLSFISPQKFRHFQFCRSFNLVLLLESSLSSSLEIVACWWKSFKSKAFRVELSQNFDC